jgi:chemotaxis methyl-accepting protein methylase
MTDDGVQTAALVAAARFLARRVGLRADPSIQGRLTRCLQEASAARGLDLPTYVALLTSDEAAVQDLLNRVTVQETSFFRDPMQFAALADRILPGITGPITVWSSASSNGQEPYSLAMTLDESGLPDWRVIASDISTKALARTRKARYATRELRGLSVERQEQYLRPVGAEWEVVPALRERVQVVQHNLLSDVPPFPVGSCQVVFCRNVLIYLSDDEIHAFLQRLEEWLPPGGWLFLGYSESLRQVTDRFRLIRVGDAFLYQRPTQVSAVPAPRPPPRIRATRPPVEPARKPRRAVRVPAGTDAARLNSAGHLAAGILAQRAGDAGSAVAAFRRCIYLDPDHVLAHLNLGLTHESAGDPASARRAFTAARAALGRNSGPLVEAALEGYALTELIRLLDAKLARSRPEAGS